MERRTFLKAAAWTVPAVAVAVGVPTASASTTVPTVKEARHWLRLTNSTITENGGNKLEAAANSMIQNDAGVAFPNVTLALIIDGQTVHSRTTPIIGAWGNDGIYNVTHNFDPSVYVAGQHFDARWIIFYEGEVIRTEIAGPLNTLPGWWFQ